MTQSGNDTILKIDGSFGEGGGQILRNCCALSHLLSKAISIEQIRKGRTVPGLRNQHLTGIQFLSTYFGHELTGAQVKSTELVLKPVAMTPKQWESLPSEMIGDTKSAGSCTLLAQMLLPVFLFPSRGGSGGGGGGAKQLKNSSSGVEEQKLVDMTFENTVLRFVGGTNVDFSPPIDTYMIQFAPLLKKHFNVSFDLELVKRGYYPYGGGEIKLQNIKLNDPKRGLSCINLVDRGTRVTSIHFQILYSHDHCKSYALELKELIPASVQSSGILGGASGNTCNGGAIDVQIQMEKDEKSDRRQRQVILIAVMRTNTDCMFTMTTNSQVPNSRDVSGDDVSSTSSKQRTKRSKQKAVYKPSSALLDEVIQFLEKQYMEGGCVDEYLQDQFIIYMALANGVSHLRTGPLTEHTRTAIHFCEMMTGAKFGIQQQSAASSSSDDNDAVNRSLDVLITCEGIGLTEQ